MKYLTVRETAAKWRTSERRVTSLCRDKRVIGAKKIANEWMIPEEAKMPLDKRTKAFEAEKRIPAPEERPGYVPTSGKDLVIVTYKSKYKKDPEFLGFTPYRICPIGAHSDYSLGYISGFAIDKGIHIAYGIKMNGIVEVESLQFDKRAQWHVESVFDKKVGDWADHLRGATIALSKRYRLQNGVSAILCGELPIGGLSSSASVIITFLCALANVNGIRLSDREMIEISKEAENQYVGVACGTMDQSCEVYCKKDHLLFLDTKDGSYELIPTPSNMKPFVIGVFFSGLQRSLAGTGINTHIDELKAAAYTLKSFAGMEYGRFADTNCRDIPYGVYETYRNKLPDAFRKRADHWFNEFKRVQKGAELYRSGDIEGFGKLVTESGHSSIYCWETGSPQLIKLYETLKGCKGVYGTRFCGAGYKGCCLALINPEYVNEVESTVEQAYLADFPELKGKYSCHICHTADGVKY